MNLIECWSCAKKMSVHDHKGNDGFCAYCGAEIEIDLEYRREHGIFDVGDKVVIRSKPFFPDDRSIQTVELEHIGKWYMHSWRHATDEEIAAGHRIESSNSQAISDCSFSNFDENEKQTGLSIKQEDQP